LRQWLLRHGVGDLIWPNALLPHRLDFLPVCLWVIASVSGRAASLRRWLGPACLGWACWGALYTALIGGWSSPDWLAAVALSTALILAGRDCASEHIARLAPVGGISFGIYVFAGPIQLAQRALAPNFSGSVLTFSVRLIGVVLVTVGFSWLVERRFQPWLATRLGPVAKRSP
jgi:hypothetical protein